MLKAAHVGIWLYVCALNILILAVTITTVVNYHTDYFPAAVGHLNAERAAEVAR